MEKLTIIYGKETKDFKFKTGSSKTLRDMESFILKVIFETTYYYDGSDIITSSQIPNYLEFYTPDKTEVDPSTLIEQYLEEIGSRVHIRHRNVTTEGFMLLSDRERNANIDHIREIYNLWLINQIGSC